MGRARRDFGYGARRLNMTVLDINWRGPGKRPQTIRSCYVVHHPSGSFSSFRQNLAFSTAAPSGGIFAMCPAHALAQGLGLGTATFRPLREATEHEHF